MKFKNILTSDKRASYLYIIAKFQPEAHGPQWFTWVNSYKSLIQHFSLSVAMAKNQNEELAHIVLRLVEDYSTNISKNVLSKYLQRDNNKCQFSLFPL